MNLVRTHARTRTSAVVVLALAMVGCLGCGKATSTTRAGGTGTNAKLTGMSEPAPSDPADEICSNDTRLNVISELASQPPADKVTGPPVRTKVGTRTTCTYPVTGGSFRMVVDEVASNGDAKRIFAADRAKQPNVVKVPNLGTDAFTRTDGTTFTIKDNKVLTVDPTHLPSGNDRTQVAQSMSFAILSCWSG